MDITLLPQKQFYFNFLNLKQKKKKKNTAIYNF
jgi:hypothetical protein